MDPIKDSIESVKKLDKKYDLFILSTAPWDNPNAWKQKEIGLVNILAIKERCVLQKGNSFSQ